MSENRGNGSARIRTVVVTMSRMLSDIITALVTDHAALDLVAEFDNRADAENRLSAIAPDLILIGLRDGEPDGIGRTLLALVPYALLRGPFNRLARLFLPVARSPPVVEPAGDNKLIH